MLTNCLLILLASAAIAANKPNLTGEWRLVAGRSQFARQAPPKSRVVQIDHREPTLRMTIVEEGAQGALDGTLFYSTDGVERVNDVLGNPFKANTRWDGSVLEMRSNGRFGPNEISLHDRYELSPDGRTLTLKRHFEGRSPSAPLDTQDQVLVHELVALRAGVARVDITPSALMPMYGYANRRCGPANGYHDPLFAKVLVLESAVSRVAIVTLDLGSMVSDRLRREVAEKLNIPVLLLAASHTHSAPFFLPQTLTPTSALGAAPSAAPAYLEETERKIFDAVQRASGSMFLARLSVASGEARLGYNRLLLRENGRARAVFDNLERIPYGPLDPEFRLLEVGDASGAPRALLVHYATHSVVLGPTNCKYSADYPGVMQAAIEAAVPGVQAMFVQGGAGDINPLFQGRTGKEDEDFALVKRMGELLAAEVVKSRSRLRPLASTSHPIRAKSEILPFGDRWDKTRSHEVGISTVLIGREIAIAALPGEAHHKLQTMWKEQAGVDFPLFYGYTFSSGGEWPGYLPDIRSAAIGGYGSDSTATRIEVSAGERILQRHLINLWALRGYWGTVPGQP